MSLYALALEANLLLGLWLALCVLRLPAGTRGRASFLATAAAAMLWGLGELLLARELVPEGVSDRIKYLGALALPAFWVGLAAQGARLEAARRVPWFPIVLLSPSVCLYALLLSARWSPLFLVTVPGGEDLRGPLYPVWVAYGYTLVLVGSAILVAAALRRDPSEAGSRRLAIGAAALVPLAANAAYLMGRVGGPLDPTPICFCVALLALRSGIFAGGLFQSLPLSQHGLIEQIPIGIAFTDRAGTLLDANPAAARLLGALPAAIVGRSLLGVLDAVGDDVRVDASTVFSGGREVGQVVLIQPPPKPDLEAALFSPADAGD